MCGSWLPSRFDPSCIDQLRHRRRVATPGRARDWRNIAASDSPFNLGKRCPFSGRFQPRTVRRWSFTYLG